MAERKVLNKYIPSDFNPAQQKIKDANERKKLTQKKVRLMAPFSMQCSTCGEFIYKGKKFNARKEDAEGEIYLGIQIYRFYIRCPLCAAELTFKTDPEKTDYVAEHGVVRNFEPWREETRMHEAVKAERVQLEENNAMLALENRTRDSKREMDILDALDEMLTKNSSQNILSSTRTSEILERIHGRQEKADQMVAEKNLEEEEDARIAREIFSKGKGKEMEVGVGGMTFVKGRGDWMDIEEGEGEWEEEEVNVGDDGDQERRFNEGIRAAFMKSSGGGEGISSKPIGILTNEGGSGVKRPAPISAPVSSLSLGIVLKKKKVTTSNGSTSTKTVSGGGIKAKAPVSGGKSGNAKVITALVADYPDSDSD